MSASEEDAQALDVDVPDVDITDVEIPDVEIPDVDIPVDGPETVAEKRLLASLGVRARTVNLARVHRLLELLDSSDAGALDEVGRQEAENLAHQVVGSAGTFGFPAASVEAVAIEDFFAAHPDVDARAAEADSVRRTLDRLRGEFAGPQR